MHKGINKITEKLAVRDKYVKKLLDANKAVQAMIEKIIEIMRSPIADSEKVSKIKTIVDMLDADH